MDENDETFENEDDDAHYGWMGCPWGLQTITTAEAAPHSSQQVLTSKITSLSFSAMMMNGMTAVHIPNIKTDIFVFIMDASQQPPGPSQP